MSSPQVGCPPLGHDVLDRQGPSRAMGLLALGCAPVVFESFQDHRSTVPGHEDAVDPDRRRARDDFPVSWPAARLTGLAEQELASDQPRVGWLSSVKLAEQVDNQTVDITECDPDTALVG
jgi:hypothetical protein